MPVYVDQLRVYGGEDAPRCFQFKPSCHMYADTLDELHALASRIGMRRSWFQNKPSLPHYDLTPRKRNLAIRAGAIIHTDQQMVEFMISRRNSLKQPRLG